jgi:hypothetical protein
MSDRKLVVAMVGFVLAACASEKPKQADKFDPAISELTEESIVAAQAAGYSLVNKDGEQVLCRRDPQTGSRLQHTTTCLTATEWTRMRNASRRSLEDLTRGHRPPCPEQGSC